MVLPLHQIPPSTEASKSFCDSAEGSVERDDLESAKPAFIAPDPNDRVACTKLLASNFIAWACLPRLEQVFFRSLERRPLFSALTAQI